MSSDPFSLTGKVAVITGSTRGIGLGIARLFAARGASLVISSRKPEACAAIEAELRAEGHQVIGVAAHAAREEDIRRLVNAAIENFGRLDVAVANAGINPSFEPLTDLPEESWSKIMDTNVGGALRLARHSLPHIAARGSGAMIILSSVNGAVGMRGSNAYGISKAALNQMTRQLAVEWGPKNVRVNAVAPGTVRTDMIRALVGKPGFMETIKDNTPMGRIAEPEDVAAAVLFFATEAARHITGQVLTVDGGQTITRGIV